MLLKYVVFINPTHNDFKIVTKLHVCAITGLTCCLHFVLFKWSDKKCSRCGHIGVFKCSGLMQDVLFRLQRQRILSTLTHRYFSMTAFICCMQCTWWPIHIIRVSVFTRTNLFSTLIFIEITLVIIRVLHVAFQVRRQENTLVAPLLVEMLSPYLNCALVKKDNLDCLLAPHWSARLLWNGNLF